MNTPLEVIRQSEALLVQLKSQRDAAVAEFDRKIERIEAELAGMKRLWDAVRSTKAGVGDAPSTGGRTLAQSIMDVVLREPGITVDAVVGIFEPAAKPSGDKSARKVVFDAIYDLKRRGKLRRDEHDRLFPEEGGTDA